MNEIHHVIKVRHIVNGLHIWAWLLNTWWIIFFSSQQTNLYYIFGAQHNPWLASWNAGENHQGQRCVALHNQKQNGFHRIAGVDSGNAECHQICFDLWVLKNVGKIMENLLWQPCHKKQPDNNKASCRNVTRSQHGPKNCVTLNLTKWGVTLPTRLQTFEGHIVNLDPTMPWEEVQFWVLAGRYSRPSFVENNDNISSIL